MRITLDEKPHRKVWRFKAGGPTRKVADVNHMYTCSQRSSPESKAIAARPVEKRASLDLICSRSQLLCLSTGELAPHTTLWIDDVTSWLVSPTLFDLRPPSSVISRSTLKRAEAYKSRSWWSMRTYQSNPYFFPAPRCLICQILKQKTKLFNN